MLTKYWKHTFKANSVETTTWLSYSLAYKLLPHNDSSSYLLTQVMTVTTHSVTMYDTQATLVSNHLSSSVLFEIKVVHMNAIFNKVVFFCEVALLFLVKLFFS